MRKVILNGKNIETNTKTLWELRDQHMPDSELVIYNGYATSEDLELTSGDVVHFIKKGTLPDEETLDHMMRARHTPNVHDTLKQGKVGIAGCGGLGSHVAIALARMGIGQLVLVDFDVVEPSNLNRQAYGVSHLGKVKVEALKALLKDINPYSKITAIQTKVNEYNAKALFEGCSIVVEAFDLPENKAMLVQSLLETEILVVAASGIAGYDSANTVVTQRTFKNLYVVGDQHNSAAPGRGLMAPRVMVAAGHQANMVIRLLLGEITP